MNITDKQIDAIFGDSPFMARDKWESGISEKDYEVVEQQNDDWRVCISNDEPKHHGYFDTYEEAKEVRRRLHVRWVFSQQNH